MKLEIEFNKVLTEDQLKELSEFLKKAEGKIIVNIDNLEASGASIISMVKVKDLDNDSRTINN